MQMTFVKPIFWHLSQNLSFDFCGMYSRESIFASQRYFSQYSVSFTLHAWKDGFRGGFGGPVEPHLVCWWCSKWVEYIHWRKSWRGRRFRHQSRYGWQFIMRPGCGYSRQGHGGHCTSKTFKVISGFSLLLFSSQCFSAWWTLSTLRCTNLMQVSCDHPETMEQDKYISFIAGVTKAAYNFFRRKLSEQVGYFMYRIEFYPKLWQIKVEKLCLWRLAAYNLNPSDLDLDSWMVFQYNFCHNQFWIPLLQSTLNSTQLEQLVLSDTRPVKEHIQDLSKDFLDHIVVQKATCRRASKKGYVGVFVNTIGT